MPDYMKKPSHLQFAGLLNCNIETLLQAGIFPLENQGTERVKSNLENQGNAGTAPRTGYRVTDANQCNGL
jgi:hypothetical protein